jgi:hypothetical protein
MKSKTKADWMALFSPACPSTALCAPSLTPTVLLQSLPFGVLPIKADQGISRHIKAYKGSNVFLRILPSRLVKRSQA